MFSILVNLDEDIIGKCFKVIDIFMIDNRINILILWVGINKLKIKVKFNRDECKIWYMVLINFIFIEWKIWGLL